MAKLQHKKAPKRKNHFGAQFLAQFAQFLE
jgi:hypothetical protein